MADDRYIEGTKIRRAVLGDAHVDRAVALTTDFDADFQRLITENVWHDVWGRPGLERPTRSLLTIVILAALGHHHELALHLRATANTGATMEEVKEALLHVAMYAGIPAANRAFAIAKEVSAEIDAAPAEAAP